MTTRHVLTFYMKFSVMINSGGAYWRASRNGSVNMEKKRTTLNTAEAAEYLGCARSYVYRMIEDGRLEAYRFGKVKGLRVILESATRIIEARE